MSGQPDGLGPGRGGLSMFVGQKVPGYNVDRVDVEAGIERARDMGFTSGQDFMVIEYALKRWQRGEEDGAIRTITSSNVSLTSFYMILAAARVAAATPEEIEAVVQAARPGPDAEIGLGAVTGSLTVGGITVDPEAIAAILREHDHERHICFDHEGYCCPADGCEHDLDDPRLHQAEVIVAGLAGR